MSDAKLRMLEARLDVLEEKLARTQRALASAVGLAAGLAAAVPEARGRVETALLDCLDDADPVTAAVLSEILSRLR